MRLITHLITHPSQRFAESTNHNNYGSSSQRGSRSSQDYNLVVSQLPGEGRWQPPAGARVVLRTTCRRSNPPVDALCDAARSATHREMRHSSRRVGMAMSHPPGAGSSAVRHKPLQPTVRHPANDAAWATSICSCGHRKLLAAPRRSSPRAPPAPSRPPRSYRSSPAQPVRRCPGRRTVRCPARPAR